MKPVEKKNNFPTCSIWNDNSVSTIKYRLINVGGKKMGFYSWQLILYFLFIYVFIFRTNDYLPVSIKWSIYEPEEFTLQLRMVILQF